MNTNSCQRQPEETPGAIYCLVGETLCRVLVWTEGVWEQLEPTARPAAARHAPGLGWVVAVPVADTPTPDPASGRGIMGPEASALNVQPSRSLAALPPSFPEGLIF
jgi:hypothetical protein